MRESMNRYVRVAEKMPESTVPNAVRTGILPHWTGMADKFAENAMNGVASHSYASSAENLESRTARVLAMTAIGEITLLSIYQAASP